MGSESNDVMRIWIVGEHYNPKLAREGLELINRF
jgi:hypothetical protein